MSWLSNTSGILPFILFCSSSVLRLLLLVCNALISFLTALLAPVVYLASYITRGLLIPVHVLGKLETLYVFLAVAAFIGLLIGSLLHVASGTLINLLHLRAVSNGPGRTAASVRAARESKRLEDMWANSTVLSSSKRNKGEPSLHAEYIDQERASRKGGKGLLSQTILEEDDDSE